MPFDESLAARIRTALTRKKGIESKKMFGGIGFLLNGNMCVGVWKEFLIVRLGPDQGLNALLEPYVKEMDITGRPMKGYIYVSPFGTKRAKQLRAWLTRGLDFVARLRSDQRHKMRREVRRKVGP